MKLILATDAIFHPLTGIGRYALELALGLAQAPGLEARRAYAHGRWVDWPAAAPEPGPAAPGAAPAHPPPAAPSAGGPRDAAAPAGPAPAWAAPASPARPGAHPGPAEAHRAATVAPPGLAATLRRHLAGFGPAVWAYRQLMPPLARWRLRGHADHLFHSPNYFLPPFGGPAVATVHDLSTLLYPQFHPAARLALMQAELPRSLARATHLITDSEFTRQELIQQLGWAPQRVSAVPLGVDPGFHPRPAEALRGPLAALGLEPGAYLLCVATIEPRKNLDRLLDAYLGLPAATRAAHPLVLAGAPGWRSEALHRRLLDAAPAGVRYLRYLPEPSLQALYAGARLFAFPSLYEGFGLPVLEALASGVPVVCSDRASLPEVAGGAARLVPAEDVDALRQALAAGLEDEAWRARARAAGLDRAARLGWPACVEATLAVYRKVLATA